MKIIAAEKDLSLFLERLKSRGEEFFKRNTVIEKIIKEVKEKGDQALVYYTRKFDQFDFKTSQILVKPQEVKTAYQKVDAAFLSSLRRAIKNITRFHQKQKPHSWQIKDKFGIVLGWEYSPIERVGIYVPGGKAVYPSSLLMSVIPAKIAAVEEIVIVSPPPISPYVFVAANELGIKKIFRSGGAQAIAALAFGTKIVPKVDKIVGPGNIFVTLAKKMLYGIVDIDKLAGPSEILIVADKTANPLYIAYDLAAQAEHDQDAFCVLLTDSLFLADEVVKEIKKILLKLKRKKIISSALNQKGAIILRPNFKEMLSLINTIAPEHLELQIKKPAVLLSKIKNAGSIFMGPFSPVAAGDYFAGSNHVLPTLSTARFFSPLSVFNFVKAKNIVNYSKKGLLSSAKDIATLAEIEGLDAHKQSVLVRLE